MTMLMSPGSFRVGDTDGLMGLR